jgi:predicted glycoside hydrolase/deacetylase ChbG (UPF0249 family)
MSTRLIVNADDYGRTASVSAGIRNAHLWGIVTSTTAMMNMTGIEESLEKAQEDCPNLGLGVHLVLTAGKPILPALTVLSLTGGLDHFPSGTGFLNYLHLIDINQVHSEWDAQIQKFIHLTGKKPDHLDSHHHTSYFTPTLFEVMLGFARELGCAIRPPLAEGNSDLPMDLPPELGKQAMDFLPPFLKRFKPVCPDNFYSSFYDQSANLNHLISILSNLPMGTSEIMCHPGFVDQELLTGSSYNIQRERELEILKNPEITSYIQNHDIQMINYSQL